MEKQKVQIQQQLIGNNQNSNIAQSQSQSQRNIIPLQITDSEQHSKNHEPKNIFRLTIVVTLISLSSFYFGFVLTYLSTIPTQVLIQVYGDIIKKDSTMPILIGAMPVGAIFGSLLAEVIMSIFTRKKYLLLINCIALLINGLIQITNIWVLLICRIIQGILVGLYMGVVPIYIHEITPRKVSGLFGAFTQMQHLFGNVVAYLLGTIFYVTHFQNQSMMRFQYQFTTIFILLQTVLMLIGYVPESPNSLIKNGNKEQAKQVIRMFNDESMVEQILKQKIIDNQMSLANKQIQKQHKMSPKSLFLGFELPFTQQLTGVNFIVTQLTSITYIYNKQLSHYTALIANTLQFFSTLFSAYLLSKIGRRTIIIIGNLSLSIINIVMGIIFLGMSKDDWPPLSGISLIMLFNIVFGITLGPVVWLYVPEIVPQKIVPLATATYWCGCSICVIVAPIITTQMNSPYAVFLFLGCYLGLMFGFNFKFVVETKDRTSEEVRKLLE